MTARRLAADVAGSGSVWFSPTSDRILVQFADSGGSVRGEATVAVWTL